jgi:hypothetical protein
MTVKEVLKEITAPEGKTNRFSKEKYLKLLTAMANDPDWEDELAEVKNGELVDNKISKPGSEFRVWLKHIIEKAGIDKNESDIVLDPSFKIDNMDGMYDLFESSLHHFTKSGNAFNMRARKNSAGSIIQKKHSKATKHTKARNPQTGEDLGEFDITTEEYYSYETKSSAPDYLKTRKKCK